MLDHRINSVDSVFFVVLHAIEPINFPLNILTLSNIARGPGGVLGYKRDGGVRRSLIFCTQKNTRLEITRIMLSDIAGTLA